MSTSKQLLVVRPVCTHWPVLGHESASHGLHWIPWCLSVMTWNVDADALTLKYKNVPMLTWCGYTRYIAANTIPDAPSFPKPWDLPPNSPLRASEDAKARLTCHIIFKSIQIAWFRWSLFLSLHIYWLAQFWTLCHGVWKLFGDFEEKTFSCVLTKWGVS